MGKAFHGPFRITDVSGINITRDGEVFVQLRDANNDVIGATFSYGAFLQVAERMHEVALEAVREPSVRVAAG